MAPEKILITGANGQIGTVLAKALSEKHGSDRILTTDLRPATHALLPFAALDILDADRLEWLIREHGITTIYHLAAILSAKGEQDPALAWQVNMDGWFNVLEPARKYGLKVFFPSTIAVFGDHIPREGTPQHVPLQPTTVYGISKVGGELLGAYYHANYGVDVRSLRYPGIIGYESLPGGGTTDYAVEIFHHALAEQRYTCFLSAETRLPMMYMADAVRATLMLMEAPSENIRVRTAYNIAGMSFSPEEIAAAIQKHIPDFQITYSPDFRQKIAESWPASIDDTEARQDWGWRPMYDLEAMTEDMIKHLSITA
ncbi:MAG: NAD-dependent epimerase/dehydratase family protein [Saprospiraceae bacterium]|nr:NAD-dependent epimerase/dehydratase family protein [Saprospiraceae bacterium]